MRHAAGESALADDGGEAWTVYREQIAWAEEEIARAILGPRWARYDRERGVIATLVCWKCRDGRTRAHHRRCPKRGNRAQASEALRRWMLERATDALENSTTLAEARRAIEKAGREAMMPDRLAGIYKRAVAKGYAAGRGTSRTQRMMDGPAGIMAGVAGRAAAEAQAHAERIMHGSLPDTTPLEWLEAVYYGVCREPAAPATFELGEPEEP